MADFTKGPTPFKQGIVITQRYGINRQNYLPYGLSGHEGIDLVPADINGKPLPNQAGTDNWDVLAIEDGEVVRDDDFGIRDGVNDAYGNYVVVLNRATRRAWWYCHMEANFVGNGMVVKRGDRLGRMGTTGNSSGPHLHLGLRLADANGNALNTANGFKGFVDPLEALQSFNTNNPQIISEPEVTTSTNPAAEIIVKPAPDYSQVEQHLLSAVDAINKARELLK